MALAIFLATGVTIQAQDRLTQYKVRNAISVRTPIMNDSINPKGEKHTKKMLLQTPVVLHLPDTPMQSLTTDTAGYLSFEKADKDADSCRALLEREVENHLSRPLGSLY